MYYKRWADEDVDVRDPGTLNQEALQQLSKDFDRFKAYDDCPKLHTIFKVKPPHWKAEQDNPLPQPAGDTLPDVLQDTLGPPGCQGTAD
ncbi:hypothetical protein WISP_33469 [Willisornis vidua]|uniref:Uncharacterized protein n=1 Tax=Willisornis vidua TaxID=1566151 RepID=A0ABQ9DNY1_9PASS|nr:hypothetical protein WISP_33469 [Willisornis vidua]